MLILTIITIVMILVAYLLGSISSAILVCRLRKLPDPCTMGSGNPGATNVLRLGGPSSAALVLLFDMLKGALPTYLSYRLGLAPIGLGLVAIAASLGHIFPLFFNFKGGKGVATAFGSIAPVGHELALMLLATWIVIILFSRYSSLAAIITAVLSPVYIWFFDNRFILPAVMLSCLILVRHRENIQRLIKGEESKI